jgi:probable HAF family extracellular repeat protein
MDALAINDSGQAVGLGAWSDGTRAILWDTSSGSATVLPPIGAITSARALGINNAGQVVGVSSTTIPVVPHAVVWTDLTPVDLGVPLGTRSEAVDVNNFGDIVGSSGSFTPFVGPPVSTDLAQEATAFLWHNGIAVNLYEASDAAANGWTNLTGAFAINDVGQIIGEGVINGEVRGFLLTPVPEPGTFVLMLVGISVVAWRIRRRSLLIAFPVRWT